MSSLGVISLFLHQGRLSESFLFIYWFYSSVQLCVLECELMRRYIVFGKCSHEFVKIHPIRVKNFVRGTSYSLVQTQHLPVLITLDSFRDFY